LVSGVRANSVPDLSEAPAQQQPSPLDHDQEQTYGGLPHSQQTPVGYIRGTGRRHGVIASPNIPLRKKSPVLYQRRPHPYYGNLPEIESHASSQMPPPPLYGPNQQHQNSYPPEYAIATTVSNIQQMSAPSSEVTLVHGQQPQQQFDFQHQGGVNHAHPGQVYYCDASSEIQQTALQQKFKTMNVATSADGYQHMVPQLAQSPTQRHIPGGFPGERAILNSHSSGRSNSNSDQLQLQSSTNLNMSQGFGSPGYGVNYNSQYNQMYSGGSVPSLVVNSSCDGRQDTMQPSIGSDGSALSVNSPFNHVPITTSEGLVDALFAEPLDASELKTLLNCGDSGLLPDPETEEALKRQP
jgi:hypothetical protein